MRTVRREPLGVPTEYADIPPTASAVPARRSKPVTVRPTIRPERPMLVPAPAAEQVSAGVTTSAGSTGAETAVDTINRRAVDPRVLDDPAVAARVRREAVVLKDVLFQGEFLAAAGVDKEVSSVGARAHLLQFREAAGAPTDPVEQLLLDVLALARLRLARVHALSEQATSPELIRTYLLAGCRLQSEISKTILTLAAYRSSPKGKTSAAAQKSNTELASTAGGEAGG